MVCVETNGTTELYNQRQDASAGKMVPARVLQRQVKVDLAGSHKLQTDKIRNVYNRSTE